MTATRITHVKVSLALHCLAATGGAPLLLLHGLGERSPDRRPRYAEAWPGPVYALDFTGHGESDIPKGGGYTAEALMGDADAALAHLGSATLVGRGLGAYVALLLAGARPEQVRGAVLADGPGLAGGGPAPGSPMVLRPEAGVSGPPDPFALVELARDLRPPEYARAFVARAVEHAVLEPALIVSAVARPPWLAAVAEDPASRQMPLADAVAAYAEALSSTA